MKRYPEIPRLADAPTVLEGGHCWITELVDGDNLRFRVQADGRIEFGSRTRRFGASVPSAYEYAARHVRATLDRATFRTAVDDVTDYVFYGVATRRRRIAYDWESLPPVLGIDVWDDASGSFRPPDAVEGIFEGLGVAPVNVLAREVNVRDFDPETYTVPDSAWYDGPALGVVIRNKAGGWAKRYHPSFDESGDAESVSTSDASDTNERGASQPHDYESADGLAAAFATEERIRRAVTTAPTLDAAEQRVFDLVVRAAHPHVFRHGGIDPGDLRSALATRVHRYGHTH